MLLSAFTAKPWRQGCSPLLAFIFRTKAAAAYTANPRSPSTAAASSSTQGGADAAGAECDRLGATGGAKGVCNRAAFDSRRVTDRQRKASWYGDDSELCATTGVGEAGSAPESVSVHVVADCRDAARTDVPSGSSS